MYLHILAAVDIKDAATVISFEFPLRLLVESPNEGVMLLLGDSRVDSQVPPTTSMD